MDRFKPGHIPTVVLVASLFAGGSSMPAHGSELPIASVSPVSPVEVHRTAGVETTSSALGDPGVSGAEASAAAVRRAEIAAFLAQAYGRSAGARTGDLAALMPVDEALVGIGSLSDAEVERIHKALPIIGHWKTAQANVTARSAATAGHVDAHHAALAEDEDLEEVRRGMEAVLDVQAGWADLIGDKDPMFAQRIDESRRLLQDATTEDLLALREALSIIPEWRTTLAPDLGALVGPGGLAPPTTWRSPTSDATSPDAVQVTTEQCSEADYSRNVLPLVIASAAVEGVRILASFASIFAAEDIKICIGLIVAVVCVDFPNPIFFILKFVEFAAARSRDGLDAAVLVAGVCTSIKHWHASVAHRTDFLIEAQQVMKSLITSDNELVERAERIDFTNREAWKLRLQLDIEANLLEPDPKADGSDENRMSLLQLTDTVCFNPEQLLPTPVFALPTPVLTDPVADVAPPPVLEPLPTARVPFLVPDPREQCGLLLVKRIVEEAILLNRMAGNNIHNANDAYDAAIVHLNANRYKSAYLRFREAYRDAVQPDAEPRRTMSDRPQIMMR